MLFDSSLIQGPYASPLGPLTLAATQDGLAGLWFDDQRHLPAQLLQRPGPWPVDAGHAMISQAAAQLDDYFSGQRKTFNMPLDLSGGTAFQQVVWRALLALPWGTSTSYARISMLIGKPSAVRAVGTAIGRNPISIVVPCHRVLGGSGALTGYAGGLARKQALLELEGVLQASLV